MAEDSSHGMSQYVKYRVLPAVVIIFLWALIVAVSANFIEMSDAQIRAIGSLGGGAVWGALAWEMYLDNRGVTRSV